MRDVVLTHGLWVPGVVMQALASHLRRAGFRCHTFAYPGAAQSLAAHAERLARMAGELGPAHFVGHSLGGLVVLEALNAHPAVEVGRVVLLGTAARGCHAGRRLARHAAGRWFLGRSEELWREGRVSRWRRQEPLGVLAGSVPIGLGRLFGALPGVNDGVVTLEETEVQGMTERVVLPVGHSQMLISTKVGVQVAAFLAHGKFNANPE